MIKALPVVFLGAMTFCTGLAAAGFIEDAGFLQDRNPALLLTVDQPVYTLDYGHRLHDSQRVLAFNAAKPYLLYHTFGYTHRMVFGKDPGDRTRTVYFSLAQNLWDRLGWGVNIGGSSVSSNGGKTTFLKFDCGVSYRLLMHPVFGEQLAGVALRNALTPSRRDHTWHSLPMDLTCTWRSNLLEGVAQPGFDLNVGNVMTDSVDLSFNGSLGFNMDPVTVLLQAGKDSLGVSSGFSIGLPRDVEFLLTLHYTTGIRLDQIGVISCRLDYNAPGTCERGRQKGHCAL